MKNTILFFATIYIFVTNVYCQSGKIVILDSITHKAIPNVSIKTAKEYVYADKNGEISLSSINSGRIVISCIGYKEKEVNLEPYIDTIHLSPKTYEIQEVNIKSDDSYKTYFLGYHRLSRFSPINITFPLLNTFTGLPGTQMAVYIPSDGKTSTIKEILLALKIESKLVRYKVHLYEVKEDGTPGNPIYSRIILNNELKKANRIDLSELNISIPTEGIFIGFEWVAQDPTELGIPAQPKVKVTSKLDTNLTYLYYKEPAKWVEYNAIINEVINEGHECEIWF